MAKVLVGMSGGVDSAVAALILKEQGYDVVGVTLRTWEAEDGRKNRCCEMDDAYLACRRIGIPYHTLNCLRDFEKYVTKPFAEDYVQGRTPNPCIVCNRHVKWDRMLYFAKVLQADYIATGHYAQVLQLPDGRYTVKTARHAEKDQTYMLWALTQEQLSRTRMPLWSLSKEEVRNLAREAGLPMAEKADSQEICFVPDGHYTEYIEEHASALPGAGNFVASDGTVLGRHKGITHYTVGQRKGLGIALGHPVYVTEIRPETDEVVLGSEELLLHREMLLKDVNFMSVAAPAAGEELRFRAKIRYHHRAASCTLQMRSDGMAYLVFDEAQRAPAPGQSAVFYDEDGCVGGGGVIERVLD